jgi:N-acetylglucosamine-1-phosphodiester alpha-N-acetylglucosaminidase
MPAAAPLRPALLLGAAAIALARLLPPPPRSSGVDDFVAVRAPASRTPLLTGVWTGHYRSTGRPFTAYVGELGDPSLLSVELPPNGCVQHQSTSLSAAFFGCHLATNAGFFDFPPNAACEGDLVVNGTTHQWLSGDNAVLGLTAGTNETVVGFIGAANASALRLRTAVSGTGWLVRAGRSYVNSSRDLDPNGGFVTEKAPRTGLGVRADGTLLLLVVDGVESTKAGPDLHEFAELFIELGAAHAVNLDGGGSTTAVLDGAVWNVPTCADTPTPVCERDVTSIVCVAYGN